MNTYINLKQMLSEEVKVDKIDNMIFLIFNNLINDKN